MAETGYYDSPMTGEELDAAFAKMAGIDESVQQAGQSAETARQYGQIVEQNAQAIRDIEENLDVILEAPSQAQAASQSAAQAAASEASAAGAAAQAGQSASAAAESAELAQQVAQGAQGWYETEEALRAAHPTGENGQWAIVGSTDTIWTWDSDTGDWKNTSVKTDLSGYYTKEQADERYATVAQGKKADTAVQSVNGVSASAGAVTIPIGAKCDLLWENSNPTAAWSQNEIVFPAEYDLYLIICVEYYSSTLNGTYLTHGTISPIKDKSGITLAGSGNSSAFGVRRYNASVSGSSITLTQSAIAGGADTTHLYPYQIYGIKL